MGRDRCRSADRPSTRRRSRSSRRRARSRPRVLEADVADIVVDTTRGTIGVAGVPASALTWGELATPRGGARRAGADLAAEERVRPVRAPRSRSAPTSPSSRSTSTPGWCVWCATSAVDDCGTVLNPLLVEGQQHGGIAAGIGQALYEEVRYDASGNPVTAITRRLRHPDGGRAALVRRPLDETPTPLNPLGAKGIGEAATIGATPAVQNAVDRRAWRTSACATSTCRARRSGCGRQSATPRPARWATPGRNHRRSSRRCARPGAVAPPMMSRSARSRGSDVAAAFGRTGPRRGQSVNRPPRGHHDVGGPHVSILGSSCSAMTPRP